MTDGLAPWVIGGMQAVARRHVGWLAEAGYEVTVVHGMDEAADVEGVRMERVPWPHVSGAARFSPWKYANELRRFSRGVNAVIDAVGPAMVYAEGPVVSAYLERPRSDRAPVIFHPHGLEMFQAMGSRILALRVRPLRSLMRHHAAHADQVISQGGHLSRIVSRDLAVPETRSVFLPNCLPADFPARSEARVGHDRRFLFVGRPEPRKGLPLLLRAFAEYVPDATLDVVGPDKPDPQAQDKVTWHGVIRDTARLVDMMDTRDVLVVPSYSEGMATVILEAFGRAMPVIATDVGATRELVIPGETGWLVPAGDGAALGAALRAACDLDNAAYRTMSRQALNMATRDFAPETVRERFLDLVASLLEDGGTA